MSREHKWNGGTKLEHSSVYSVGVVFPARLYPTYKIAPLLIALSFTNRAPDTNITIATVWIKYT